MQKKINQDLALSRKCMNGNLKIVLFSVTYLNTQECLGSVSIRTVKE